jgi:hypothetical protein
MKNSEKDLSVPHAYTNTPQDGIYFSMEMEWELFLFLLLNFLEKQENLSVGV